MDFDVSAVVTLLGAGVLVGIGAIGAAKLIPVAAIKAWNWFTAAIRGG